MIISKRLAGLGLVAIGLLAIAGLLLGNLVGAGNWGGIGPFEKKAIAVGIGVILVGLSLVPLGDRPA